MAATRENVLAAISQYVETHKRRAPSAEVAVIVGDTLPNVKLIIQQLVEAGSITSSRGRNGGALPDGMSLDKKAKPAKAKSEETASSESDLANQFAQLIEKLEQSDEIQAQAV